MLLIGSNLLNQTKLAMKGVGSLLLLTTHLVFFGVSASADTALDSAEVTVVDALRRMASGDAVGARQLLEPVVKLKPSFRLAQLVYADALQTLAGRGPRLDPTDTQNQLRALRHEAMVRTRYVLNVRPPGAVPSLLIETSSDVGHVIVVDAQASRLLVFERGSRGLSLIRDHYVSIGKNGAKKHREGDQKTPVGVYFVTGRIKSDALPDFYGVGALPVNYPNEWDVRLGRTGYGIWIHGVPSDTYSRPPRASDGCMALSNEHLSDLLRTANGGELPVLIADSVSWIQSSSVQRERSEWRQRLNGWLSDWESRDALRYARHYSSNFQSKGYDQSSWLAHKRRVNQQKRFIRIKLNQLSLFHYPGEKGMVVATFEQDYHSNNFAQVSRKRQYWRLERDGVWRIVYEGPAQLSADHLRGIPYSARARLSSLD